MTEVEALEIVRDRVRQTGSASDVELEQALSTIQRAIHLARAQALVAAGALTANENDRIYVAACDAAESIRAEDVREFLRRVGFTELAADLKDEKYLRGCRR